MDSKVATVAATPDPTYGKPPPKKTTTDTVGTVQPVAPSQDQADMRLVIEEDKATNSYVYKTINRLTGEVIQQLPREQVLQLREQLEYEAGSVVKTKA
jgi:flagellar protein FlaG